MKSPDRVQLSALPPLSLYIHFPWCEKKCPYCDFNSHQVKSTGFDEDRYIKALLLDLQTELPRVWGRKVHTIFIGGGTPSLLSVRGMNQLLSSVRSLLPLEADAEITMEANPGSIEADKLAGFADCGIIESRSAFRALMISTSRPWAVFIVVTKQSMPSTLHHATLNQSTSI